jgi:hypothetical protein
MTDEELERKFSRLLADIDLDRRYYGYSNAHRSSLRNMMHLSASQLASVLASTQLEFKQDKREKFYAHVEKIGVHEAGLNISFTYSMVELIMYIEGPGGCLGGPVHSLAKMVGESRDPNFNPDPPYPKLPFSNIDELREAVQLSVSLFHDFKTAFFADKELKEWSERAVA